MLYFHDMVCLSPVENGGIESGDTSLVVSPVVANRLTVKEPAYPGIPPNVMRRMGKCVRMCVGASLPLIEKEAVDGIIIGTADGGMEDCIKFLNQIIEYDEGKLTPGNFVQSTANGPAAQVALVTRNNHYNITHVHRGLAFEQALLDAMLLLRENAGRRFLVGAVDEVSTYNFNIDRLAGWYRESAVNSKDIFTTQQNGSIAGEGAVMMIVSANVFQARAALVDLQTMHTPVYEEAATALQLFLKKNNVSFSEPVLLISGENGDRRLQQMNLMAESLFPPDTPVLRYKHLTGEYATATSYAVWLAVQIFAGHNPAAGMIKKGKLNADVPRILISNCYRGLQHSFILLEKGPSIR